MDLIERKFVRRLGAQVLPAVAPDRTPTFTVVVPCYNYGRFLVQCVESLVHGQPGIDLEVIVVDDKSTDDSLAVARGLEARYACVKVIAHAVNKGHIATYNDGLADAAGEFVLLLSADDLVTPGALSRSAALLVAHPNVGLVYGRALHFSSSLPPARQQAREWVVWKGVDWLKLRCRSGYNVVDTPTAVVRRSIISETGGYDPALPHAGDFEMWLRAAAVSDVGYLPDTDQAYYRLHGSNMQSTRFWAGTPKGLINDLEQRWRCFDTVLSGAGRHLEGATALLGEARRTLSREALERAAHSFAKQLPSNFVDEFEALARRIMPDAPRTPQERIYALRNVLRRMPLILNPLWLTTALRWRLGGPFGRWRHRRLGV